EDVLGQPLALDGLGEDVRAEDLGTGLGQVDGAEGRAVRAPLSGVDVRLSGPGGHAGSVLLVAVARRHASHAREGGPYPRGQTSAGPFLIRDNAPRPDGETPGGDLSTPGQ